jgi:hypothetical protein
MMSQEIALKVIDVLNANGVAYMLVGSLSTNFHSIVRSTKDADIVIQSSLTDAGRLLGREYPELKLDPQLGFESVTGSRKLMLRADAHEFVVELFALTDDPHDQERFRRRIRLEWAGRAAWVATAEDAIITKLRWSDYIGREKDIVDARNVIASMDEQLDWPYIEHWCDLHGSRQTLEKIRRELRQL